MAASVLRRSHLNRALCARRKNDQSVLIRLGRYTNDRFPRSNREGAQQTLEALSKQHQIYVATNAVDSTESDIKFAFDRVGLSPFISGYFCKANLGIGKGTPEFFNRIIDTLNVEPKSVVMVGDSYDKDIEPAVTVGIQAIWFNPMGKVAQGSHEVKEIRKLSELCT